MTDNRSQKADVRSYADRRGIKYTEALRAFSPPPPFRLPTAAAWETYFVEVGAVGDHGLPPMFVRSVPNNGVEDVTFQIPLGLDLATVRGAVGSVRMLSGCAYLNADFGDIDDRKFTLHAAQHVPVPPFRLLPTPRVLSTLNMPFACRLDGSFCEMDANSAPHLLIAGGPGVGKSKTVQAIISGYRARGGTIRVLVPNPGYLSDLGGGFTSEETATSLDEAVAMLSTIHAEMLHRIDLLSSLKLDTVYELPAKLAVPPMLVAVDALLPTLFQLQSKTTELGRSRSKALSTIAGQLRLIGLSGRFTGIRVVATVQQVSREIRAQVSSGFARLLIGRSSFGEIQAALRNAIDAPALPAGERNLAIFEPESGPSEIVRMLFITGTHSTAQLALGLA